MDLDFIEKLIGLVSRSPVRELEIERDGMRVRIAKPGAFSPPAPQAAWSPQPAAAASAATSPAVAAATRHALRAPLTGVFYRAAAPGEPPLVSVGETVEEGGRIGILEAMKTFNVVESDRAGKVVEIPFEDGAAVQAGDVLFVLEDAG